MSRRALWGIVLAAAAAGCGGEDEDPPGGGIGGEAAGCVQAPKCVASLRSRIEAICVDDECVDVGVRENGAVVTGDMLVYSRYPFEAGTGYTIASYGVTLFHPRRPNGATLTCDDVLALAPEKRRNAGYTNVLEWTTGRLEQAGGSNTFPASLSSIPVNEPGVRYLVLSELWSGTPDSVTGENRGAVVAEGCAEGFVALPGPYLDGTSVLEDHTFLLETHVRPAQ